MGQTGRLGDMPLNASFPFGKGSYNVTIELVPGGRMPEYKTSGSNGADCYARIATGAEVIQPGETNLIPLGFRVAVPNGWAMLLMPRSGLSLKTSFRLANAVGLVDSDFTDEVCALAYNTGREPITINHGDRIAQAVITQAPQVYFVEGKVGETSREGGFGSTGLK